MVRLKGFQELTPIDEALDKFFTRLNPRRLGTIIVPLEDSLGRITSKDVTADRNVPSFDRSAVDGYALRAKDTFEASPSRPKTFRLVEKDGVEKGEAKEIWTGNPLPKSSDAVVMLEHAKITGKKIMVLSSLTPGSNVSKEGEDLKKGEIAVKEGVRLKPYHMGLLATLGMRRVDVVRKPKVALLATGSELIALGDVIKPHKVIEINGIILSGMCTGLGAEAFNLGIAEDDEEKIAERIRKSLAMADMVITTGGTSVGVHDLVPNAVEKVERCSVVVHGMAMRPGMPTALAVVHKKPIVILSGNPVAAMIGFEVFVRPLILRMLGVRSEERAKIKAILTRRVAGVLGRRVFLRVKVVEKGGEYLADPISVKGSGILTTMTRADGYVIIPENREGLKENELVTVNLLTAV